MNQHDRQVLYANVDKVVRITTHDGESLIAKIVMVSDDDQDLVYDLVSSNRAARYEKFDVQPAYRIRFEEIEAVEPADGCAPPR